MVSLSWLAAEDAALWLGWNGECLLCVLRSWAVAFPVSVWMWLFARLLQAPGSGTARRGSP